MSPPDAPSRTATADADPASELAHSRAREARLTLALEAACEGYWEWEVTTGKAEFSPQYYALLGYPPEAFSASFEAWAERLHPDEREAVVTRIRDRLAAGHDRYAETFRMRTADGEWRWFLGRGQVVERSSDGAALHLVGTHSDVTEAKRAELELAAHRERLQVLVEERTRDLERANQQLQALLTERERSMAAQRGVEAELRTTGALLETVFDAIPDVLGVQRPDHSVVRYNAAGYRLLGRTPEQVAGRRCYELVGHDQPCASCATAEARRTGRPARIERFEEGLERWLDVRAYPVCDETGRVTQIVEHLRDVTVEKRAAERERELENQLYQAQKMEAVGTLAGGIAHDFNNLLMGVGGTVALLLKDLDPDHPHYRKLRNVERYVESGSDLTRQLLGFARRGRYQVSPMDLHRLLQETVEMFCQTRKEAVVHLDLDPTATAVAADRGQVEQVFLNLLLNAVQAMPQGGEIRVATRAVELDAATAAARGLAAGGYVEAAVTDSGVGMDRETRQRVFEPFFTTKEMGRGTGLGLASAYGIVRSHGGWITVESKPGKGSTFRVGLPASNADLRQPGPPPSPGKPASGTILLVDDEPMIQEVAAEILESLGYRVFIAGDGSEALEVYLAQRQQIDLVILDMIMPGMGGAAVFEQLRAVEPAVKVLLSSGYSAHDTAAELLLAKGCNGFLQKPFRVDELAAKLTEILGPATQS